VRHVKSKRTARALAAVIVVGLGLVVAFAGSSTTVGTKTAGSDFRRLAPGGAPKGSAAQVSGRGPEIKQGVRVEPTVFKGSVRALPHVAAVREFLPERETPELSAGLKQPLPGAEAPSRLVTPTSTAPAPDPTVSFNGLGKAAFGAGWPPDTVGDVGPDHFVQAVNTSIGIFSKSGGAPLAAFTFNSLWATAGTGTLCDTSNRGDPTVIYDPKGGRWFVADFAFSGSGNTPPFYECIAVSKTSDPVAGGWYFYAIRTDDASHPWLADYPKMGIWPDGLYMTANMFDSSSNFREVRVWAFNRSDLEAGLPVRNVVADLASPTYFSLMPSNMRTATGVPPAGRENLLVSESGTLFAFEVWKFHVDYAGSGSTFTSLPINVSQTTYTVAASTVPTPVNSLDSLRERMMMQSQYTNIGGVESLWVNHTVRCCGASSPAGIQWAQINVTGGSVATAPVQQQLYPSVSDTLHRWMGSLAVDQNGDMALGYSVANATTNPDIRYAGRLAGDTLNTLPQTETSMLTGVTLGTQSGSCGGTCTRWGDYSAMTLDPDGCRYWYTQEYYGTTGLNWLTRIGSFSFPSCTAKAYQTISFGAVAGKTLGEPDFTVSATASSGLPVTFSASGNCTVAGSTVHLTGVGSCTVTAFQSGDSTRANAPDVSQTFAIAKGSQTIAFGALPDKTVVDADFGLDATASTGLTVSFAASGNCTVSGSTVHLIGVGSCTVTASQAGDSNYNAAPVVSQTFSITKANQAIVFAALGAKTFGDADFAVSATASSGLAVSFVVSGACTLSGTSVHLTGAGSCAVTASQAGDATYKAATDVPQTFSITKANQSIVFAALGAKTFGEANFAVSATASSGLAVSLVVSGSCTLSGTSVHLTGAGSCTVTASQAGDANYNAAADLPQTFTIAKASQTITFGALANKTYGAANFGVSATASAGLAVSFGASGPCTVSGSIVHVTGAGSCMVTASQPGDANYAAAPSVSQTFSIARPPCKVPKVTGKRLAAAKSALTRAHCRTGTVRRAYSSKKKGLVRSQSRRPGRVLATSSKINLVVSRGRRP
jgi:hypothetical protein